MQLIVNARRNQDLRISLDRLPVDMAKKRTVGIVTGRSPPSPAGFVVSGLLWALTAPGRVAGGQEG